MKKALCLGLAAILACGFCGCAKKDPDVDKYTLLMNGKAISAPVTIESLGKDYSLDAGVILSYKGEFAAGVKFDENSAEQDELKKPIQALVRNPMCSSKTRFSVGGIEQGDNDEDVLSVYGEPTYKEESLHMWTYCKDGKAEDDYWLGFEFDDSGTVTWIYYRIEQ